ncbi:hypothetical protein FND36_12490 [Lachnospiraceae bacterium KGMB03038]|nr:hypothetical protein FND36_12490 [Lachnospiraceae bacterium KGMB03038]
MKNKEYWLEWGRKAGVRAIRTVAQTAVAGIGTAAAIGQVDWKYVLSASVLAGVISLLTCIAGLPEVEGDNGVEYDEGIEPEPAEIAEAERETCRLPEAGEEQKKPAESEEDPAKILEESGKEE